MGEWIDNALEIDEFYELMCDRSGNNSGCLKKLKNKRVRMKYYVIA